MRLPGHGEEGQRRLAGAKVLLIGAGGLGSPAALYLAAAGVGTLGIADPDVVELSNLHRQVLHSAESVGLPKTVSAAEMLGALNPAMRIVLHPEGFQPTNALELAARYDLLVDGADNFATRFLAADACALASRPLVHGSVLRHGGQVGLFLPGKGCYRCLYPAMPDPSGVPTCGEAGVLGATCGVIGSWMAAEAISSILGHRTASRLLLVDVEAGSAKPVAINRDGACPCCGDRPAIREIDPARYASDCAPGRPATGEFPAEMTVQEADRWLASPQPPLLLDVREPDELSICRLPGSLDIPLGQLPQRRHEIPSGRPLLVICHHGGRSQRAVQFLRGAGHSAAINVKGGIDAWARLVDTSIPRY